MNSQIKRGENGLTIEPVVVRVRNGQRGGGTLRAIVWTAILLAIVFVCYKIVPAYYANYQFEDWLKTQIPFLMVNHTSDESLTASIIKELGNEGVTVTKENIKIIQNNPNGINVQINYDVPCDFIIYQQKLHFSPSMNSQSLVQ
jgi:hypothetical protein